MSDITGGTPVKRIPVAIIASGTTDRQTACNFCRSLTYRVIASKAPVTAPVADLLWCCDYCLEAIRTMEFKPQEFMRDPKPIIYQVHHSDDEKE